MRPIKPSSSGESQSWKKIALWLLLWNAALIGSIIALSLIYSIFMYLLSSYSENLIATKIILKEKSMLMIFAPFITGAAVILYNAILCPFMIPLLQKSLSLTYREAVTDGSRVGWKYGPGIYAFSGAISGTVAAQNIRNASEGLYMVIGLGVGWLLGYLIQRAFFAWYRST